MLEWWAEELRAVLAAGDGLAAITVTEVTPKNAAAEDGLLERFAESLVAAIA